MFYWPIRIHRIVLHRFNYWGSIKHQYLIGLVCPYYCLFCSELSSLLFFIGICIFDTLLSRMMCSWCQVFLAKTMVFLSLVTYLSFRSIFKFSSYISSTFLLSLFLGIWLYWLLPKLRYFHPLYLLCIRKPLIRSPSVLLNSLVF